MKDDIKNNTWLSCEYQNGHGKKQIMELLLLVIPFEDTGAMEYKEDAKKLSLDCL